MELDFRLAVSWHGAITNLNDYLHRTYLIQTQRKACNSIAREI